MMHEQWGAVFWGRLLGAATLLTLPSCGTSEPPTTEKSNGSSLAESLALHFPDAVAGEWMERDFDGLQSRVVARVPPGPESATQLADGRYGVVVGAYSNGLQTGKYSLLVEPATSWGGNDLHKLEKEMSGIVAPAPSKLSDQLQAKLKEHPAKISVIVTFTDALTESLEVPPTGSLASFDTVEDRIAREAAVRAAIDRRKEEARRKQEAPRAVLKSLGIATNPEDGFWLVNAMPVHATPAQVLALAQETMVKEVSFDAPTTSDWTGSDISSAAYFNAGHYLDAGNDGEVASPVTGNTDLTIAILDIGFNPSHPVFLDAADAASRIKEKWNCNNNPCTTGVPSPPSDQHGTHASAAAAADATDDQVAGNPTFQRNRSGVAREAAILMIEIGTLASLTRGLERAVDSGADVVNESRGGDSPCDGNAGPWDEAVYAAESAGVLVTASAGNEGDGSTCTLSEAATVPSILTVGALEDPASGDYSTVNIRSTSSTGPVSAVVDYQVYTAAFTGVDLVVTGRTQFAASAGEDYDDVLGTSFAAPKVAGAGVLFRDWAIDMGWGSYSYSPGWLRANLIAMTDRANGPSTYNSARFHRRWGGGRFQMRRYTIDDHPSGLWRWETATYTISDGETIYHRIGGNGAEPSGLQQIKAYALVREVDGYDVADIDLGLWTDNCTGSGSDLLSYDVSLDYKSMVQCGSAAAGENLCVQLYGDHVPGFGTRTVQLVVYYSDETELR